MRKLIRFGWSEIGNGLRRVFASRFQQQFNVIPCAQADKTDPIGQILSNLDGAGPNRSGTPKQNNILHAVSLYHSIYASTWRRYRYMIGALNSKLSSKSSIPPIPGKNSPECFTQIGRA